MILTGPDGSSNETYHKPSTLHRLARTEAKASQPS